jgi:signal transduction histidine kinase
MSDAVAPWQQQTVRLLIASEWGALVIGIVATFAATGVSTPALLAAGAGGIWVLAATVVPVRAFMRPFVTEVFALVGVALSITAVTLTDVVDSPYLLLAMTPALHTIVVGGNRTGLATALLTAALMLVVAYAQEGQVAPIAGQVGIVIVVSLVMAQIRRILVDIQQRSDEAHAASSHAQSRIEELRHTHELLTQIAAATDGSDLSVPLVGRAALNALEQRYPDMHGSIALVTDKGPLVVARAGTSDPGRPSITIPLEAGTRTVGLVVLETAHEIGDPLALTESLQPVALAFANALILQDMAGKAVNEERTRLARELHDEFGPSLASLGLSLDVALLEAGTEQALSEHLSQLRGTVTRLVDEVRVTVADLREQEAPGLRRRLTDLVADLPNPDRIVFDFDERRPARPSLAREIHAIVVEAVRNAARHTDADAIRVSGWLDFDRGRLVIEDDGSGFDPKAIGAGHYGLEGMRERAAAADIDFDLTTGSEGTRIVVEWGNR